MAMTTKTVKSSTGMTITVFNNDAKILDSVYDTTNHLTKAINYNTSGIITKTDNYTYNSAGNVLTKISNDGNGKVIEVLNYGYTSNKLTTITHVNNAGKITATDYYINGKIDHTDTAAIPTPVPTSTNTLTQGWSTVNGYGGIDVLKALSDATGTQIKDVATPNLNWSLNSAHFDDAWNAGFTGKGIVIADIDSGIDLKNADLTKNLSKSSFNFITNDANVQDDFGHGTFTASELIASNNGDSITGGAYDAELMVLKVMNSNGFGTAENISKAIYYAVDHGADVINLSMNAMVAQPLIKAAFDYANSHDVLIAVSSGNKLANTPNYPAIYATTNDNVCAVGATFNLNGNDIFNAVSSKAGSNTAYNYVNAGGTDISGYDQSGNVTKMAGTSMAAPLVAAEMAILKQAIESMGKYSNSVIDEMVMQYVTHDTHNVQVVGVQPFVAVDNLIA